MLKNEEAYSEKRIVVVVGLGGIDSAQQKSGLGSSLFCRYISRNWESPLENLTGISNWRFEKLLKVSILWKVLIPCRSPL